jgi:sulfide:quinone oxidoreductase
VITEIEQRSTDTAEAPMRVVIAGAGAAGAEAALTLHRIAGAYVETTIVAPHARFVHFPAVALAPFASGASPHIALSELASFAGAKLHRGRLVAVDPESHVVDLGDGETLAYDALLIAVGAVQHAPFRRALTFGTPGSEERMHGLIQDVEDGYIRRIAFVVPPGTAWPLPVYELALLTAERAFGMCVDVELTLITPEAAPLEVFGPQASRDVERWLSDAGVALEAGVRADMLDELLSMERVVTVPALSGPRIDGLPSDDAGFLPVDSYGRVIGTTDVFAAGDATDFAVKQGGVACRQADTAAQALAARAGVAIDPAPFVPTVRALLVTDRHVRILDQDLDASVETAPPHSRSKLAGRELSRWLVER